MEKIIEALNKIKKDKYPQDDSLFIFTEQINPVNESSFKLFRKAELSLWFVKRIKDENKKVKVAYLSYIDRYSDPSIKENLMKSLYINFAAIILDWLSSGGLQKLIEDGME